MKKKIFIAGLLLCFIGSLFGREPVPNPTEKHVIDSKVLKEKRDIFISLPYGYEKKQKKCIVFFVLDGQYHFPYIAALVNYYNLLKMVPPAIVVGIPPIKRFEELSYNKDRYLNHAVEGEKFFKFIKSELIPYVESKYRTIPYRILLGHSLGAMFTLYTFSKYPDVFDIYLAISPDFTRDLKLLPRIRSALKTGKLTRKYLFAAAEKYRNNAHKKGFEEFVEVMKGAPEGLKWTFRHMEKENHNSLVPTGFIEALHYLFYDKQNPAAQAQSSPPRMPDRIRK